MMILSSNLPKKRGRPLGSRDKRARKVAKKVGSKSKVFKRSNASGSKLKKSKPLPIGAISWQDAYEKTFVNLDRAYKRLVELQDVKEQLDQANIDLAGLSTIINYLELRLEDQYRKSK
jgi:hypothetical protein